MSWEGGQREGRQIGDEQEAEPQRAESQAVTAGKAVAVRKRRRPPAVPWKKPKDMPKRPLSAYNLFFKAERELLLAEGGGRGGGKSKKRRISGAEEEAGEKKPKGLGFANLAKTIAAKWKTISSIERKPYEEQAAVDKSRYDSAVAIWREKQKEKKKAEQLKMKVAESSTLDESGSRAGGGTGDTYPSEWFDVSDRPQSPLASSAPQGAMYEPLPYQPSLTQRERGLKGDAKPAAKPSSGHLLHDESPTLGDSPLLQSIQPEGFTLGFAPHPSMTSTQPFMPSPGMGIGAASASMPARPVASQHQALLPQPASLPPGVPLYSSQQRVTWPVMTAPASAPAVVASQATGQGLLPSLRASSLPPHVPSAEMFSILEDPYQSLAQQAFILPPSATSHARAFVTGAPPQAASADSSTNHQAEESKRQALRELGEKLDDDTIDFLTGLHFDKSAPS